MEIQFKIVGILLIVVAVVHLAFPKLFNWKAELARLSLINRQLMEVHTFFIALVVLLIGLLFMTSASELLESVLGKRILLGLGVFWGLRLLIQFFGYSPKLWKGKKLETLAHILFSVFWLYITTLCWLGFFY